MTESDARRDLTRGEMRAAARVGRHGPSGTGLKREHIGRREL